MEIDILPGKYVVAVSGGVDSMVLLRLLTAEKGIELIVAHFDHGMRPDSAMDREFVQAAAKRHKLPFFYEDGKLGPHASEATARAARYQFLRRMQKEQGASAIITAHHQDDLLETAVVNLLRGTGRKGLSALRSTAELRRPLLHIPKTALIDYAQKHHLAWHEDPTNQNTSYLRNYIRHHILPALQPAGRQQLLALIQKSGELNTEIDTLLQMQRSLLADAQLPRSWFVQLPHQVAAEVMAAWLRQHDLAGFNKKTIERLVVSAKTAAPGKSSDIFSGATLEIQKSHIRLLAKSR